MAAGFFQEREGSTKIKQLRFHYHLDYVLLATMRDCEMYGICLYKSLGDNPHNLHRLCLHLRLLWDVCCLGVWVLKHKRFTSVPLSALWVYEVSSVWLHGRWEITLIADFVFVCTCDYCEMFGCMCFGRQIISLHLCLCTFTWGLWDDCVWLYDFWDTNIATPFAFVLTILWFM